MAKVTSISAITLATRDMRRAVEFYGKLGFQQLYGGADSSFTSFEVGTQYLNIIVDTTVDDWRWWGRAIFYVDDVDAFHQNAIGHGLEPEAEPSDAPWGERYFHLVDPDGHELSFAAPINLEP